VSTDLYYEPVRRTEHQNLGVGLKWAIEKRFGSQFVLTRDNIGFLEGVAAAHRDDSDTARDCEKLIEEINTHGEVRVWIE
jgi:hypothetical protein